MLLTFVCAETSGPLASTTGQIRLPLKNHETTDESLVPMVVGLSALVIVLCVIVTWIVCKRSQNKESKIQMVEAFKSGFKAVDANSPHSLEDNVKAEDVLEPGATGLNRQRTESYSHESLVETTTGGGNTARDVSTEGGGGSELKVWLNSVVGLPQYVEVFIRAGFESLETVQVLERYEDLQYIGIESKAHQIKLRQHIKALKQRTLGDV